MKLYIRAVSIDDMRKQYPDMPQRKFAQLVDVDPTANYAQGKRGKYMPWVFKQEKLGNFINDLGTDEYQNVHDALADFAHNSNAFPEKDINKYKTVEDFLHAHNVALNDPNNVSKRQKRRDAKNALLRGESTDDVELLVEDGSWSVWMPKTQAGDSMLAEIGCDKSKPYVYPDADENNMKARWCTAASQRWFDDYTAQGPLYVFIDSNDPIHKFQCCPDSNSWWFDWWDRAGTIEDFFEFCGNHHKIADYFGVTFDGGVTTFQGKVVAYDSSATTITVPDGMTSLPNFTVPKTCTTMILPDSITAIPSRAFLNTNIVTLQANNIQRIGPNAFNNSQITNIDLSGVNDRIGSNAFANCKNLTSVTLGTPTIGPQAFANSGITGTITVTPEIKLEMMALDNCPNLTVVWDKPDESYRFKNIKLLVLNQDACPELYARNEGNVDIELA